MTKRFISVLLIAMLIFALAACSNTNQDNNDSGTAQATEAAKTDNKPDNPSTASGKDLVVYFSVPETDKADNMTDEEDYSTYIVDGKVLGNVQYVAMTIQTETGADIFRIEPETPYPTDHAELEAVATQEKANNDMPAIKDQIEGFEQYDRIFVGYPNWYGDMPRIMYSFFESYDFSGKTIAPFVVSGGSGFSNTINTIKELEPNANVIENGYSVLRTQMDNAESDIAAWVDGL